MARSEPIGQARVDVTASTAGFVRQVDRAGAALRRQQSDVRRLRASYRSLSRQASGMARNLFSVRSAIALTAGSGGLGLLVRNQAKYGAALLETAQRTGLTVQRLQTLQRVFQADGATVDQFNRSFEVFLRNTNEASQGVAEYADVFRQAGIDVEQFLAQGNDQAALFEAVADGIAGLATQYERVGVARDLFGRAGGVLVNQLQRGSDAIREQELAFEALGIVTLAEAARLKALEQSYADLGNVVRTASAKSIAEVADDFRELNDALSRNLPDAIGRAANGLAFMARNLEEIGEIAARVLGVWLVYPRLARIAAGIALLGRQALVARSGMYALAASVRFLGRVLRRLIVVEALIQLVNFAVAFNDAMDRGRTTTQALADAAEAVRENFLGIFRDQEAQILQPASLDVADIVPVAEIGELNDGLVEADKLVDRLRDQFRDAASEAAVVAQTVGLQGPELERVAAKARALSEFSRERLIALHRLRDAERELALVRAEAAVEVDFSSLPDAQAEAAREYARELSRLAVLRAEAQRTEAAQALQDLEAQRSLVQDLARGLGRMAAQQARIREAADYLAPVADETSRTARIVETLNDLWDQGAITLDQYRAALERLEREQSVFADVIEATEHGFESFFTNAASDMRNLGDAVRQLGRTIETELIRRLVSQPLAGIASGFSGDVWSWLFGGGSGAPPRRFARGGFAGPGFALVGEEGPEIVDFRSPARVYPNAGMGGVNLHQVFNISSTDGPGVRRALAEATPAIVDASVAAVQTNLARPSGLRNAARRRS